MATRKPTRPTNMTEAALMKMKRPDLLALYESWLTFAGFKLDPNFSSNRKNTKAVIAGFIIERQAMHPIGSTHDEATENMVRDALHKAADSIDVTTPQVGKIKGSKDDLLIADLARGTNDAAWAPPVPTTAPKSRKGALMDAMRRLYHERPDFLPTHLRPVGFIR